MSAPIEDVSDNAFRTLCFKYGADLTFTEMIRVEGLSKNNAATWSRLDFHDLTPTMIQLMAGKEYSLKKFLSMFKPHESFEGFNFNLGCPSPDIIRIGQGSAMIKRISKTKKLVDIINKAGYPVSIKMRLGLNKFEKDKKVYLNLIKEVDVDFFILHARYGSQTYNDAPDYSVYQECCETGKIIIANGDIDSKEKVERLRSTGVKGVMVGRASVKNPAIFNVLKGKPAPSIDELKKEYIELAERYNAPFRYRKNVLKHLGSDEKMNIIFG